MLLSVLSVHEKSSTLCRPPTRSPPLPIKAASRCISIDNLLILTQDSIIYLTSLRAHQLRTNRNRNLNTWHHTWSSLTHKHTRPKCLRRDTPACCTRQSVYCTRPAHTHTHCTVGALATITVHPTHTHTRTLRFRLPWTAACSRSTVRPHSSLCWASGTIPNTAEK